MARFHVANLNPCIQFCFQAKTLVLGRFVNVAGSQCNPKRNIYIESNLRGEKTVISSYVLLIGGETDLNGGDADWSEQGVKPLCFF